jgi:hypothetical protein
MKLNSHVHQGLAAVLALVLMAAWFNSGPAPAAAAPVDPATLGDFSLCDAWHANPTDGMTRELASRHILTDAEMNAARGGELFVGMRTTAVVCALGGNFTRSAITTKYGETVTWVFPRANARPVIVRLENGLRVESFAR